MRDALASVLRHELRTDWAALQQVCTDRSSRLRLMRLLERLTGTDRGAMESALAELELATVLLRAGCRITFLPESQARTADLECGSGTDRFYVEVTALVGSGRPVGSLARHPGTAAHGQRGESPAEEDPATELIRRVLARVAQKARQLEEYCAPVVLAITLPPRDRRPVSLDLKALAGALTTLLPSVPGLSAVLLSFWDIDPAPARSTIRLANVTMVERPQSQRAYPRVRMLVLNPRGRNAPSDSLWAALKGIL